MGGVLTFLSLGTEEKKSDAEIVLKMKRQIKRTGLPKHRRYYCYHACIAHRSSVYLLLESKAAERNGVLEQRK